jgi:hypothetical protein
MWANASSTSGFASPITSRDDVNAGVSTHGFIIYNDNGGNWNFWTGDGNPGWDTLPAGPVSIGTWTHLAISYDSVTETKSFYMSTESSQPLIRPPTNTHLTAPWRWKISISGRVRMMETVSGSTGTH